MGPNSGRMAMSSTQIPSTKPVRIRLLWVFSIGEASAIREPKKMMGKRSRSEAIPPGSGNISVSVFQFRRIGAAGGRDDAVFAQVEGHLAVVVGGVPHDHGGDTQARIGSRVGAFDGSNIFFES